MHHYVYYSYEDYGRGYLGSRSCKCEPEKDTRYFGSFTDKSFKPTQKIILATYETREEALRAEISLHEFYQVHKNPHFANRAKQTSVGFLYIPSHDEAVELGKISGNLTKEKGIGIHAMSKEELKEAGSKGGKVAHERGICIHAQTPEEKSALGKLGGKSTAAQKWQCTITGFITNPGNLTQYQRARSIDTSNRIRLIPHTIKNLLKTPLTTVFF